MHEQYLGHRGEGDGFNGGRSMIFVILGMTDLN
jgi:hypothetical protein